MWGPWVPLVVVLVCLGPRAAVGQCPPRCLCFRTTVRCMFLQLTAVPDKIPAETTVLDLRFNKIRVIASHAFRHLNQLNTLLLNNNQITGIEDNAFFGLKELRYLYLYKNRIQSVSKHAFRGLSKLEQLYLHFNKIQNLEDETFGKMPALERLFLHHNQLSRVPRKAFQQLQSLRRLRLDSNALVCDCELLWLVEMLIEKSGETVQAAATCQEPGPLQGKALQALKMDDFQCKRPSLLVEPTDVEVSFGGTAYFHCRAEGDPSPHIVWYHNSNEIPSEGLDDERLSYLSEGSTLMITGAQEGDQGTYECMAKNPLGESKSRPARMMYKDVQQAPLAGRPPELVSRPVDVRATEGSEVTFQCQARGDPTPEVTWMHGHQTLSPDNDVLENRFHITGSGSLVISAVRPQDAGPYQCLATNSIGRIVAFARLHVNQPARIVEWPTSEEIVVSAGRTVDLTCRSTGEPAPKLTWLKDGRLVETRRRVAVLQGGAVLRIVRARVLLDDGIYSCQARNEAGRDDRQIRLRVVSGHRGRNRIAPLPTRATTTTQEPTTMTAASSQQSLLESSVSQARSEVDRSINSTLADLLRPGSVVPGLGGLLRALRFPEPEARELAKAADVFHRAMELLQAHRSSDTSEQGPPLSLTDLSMLANMSGCLPPAHDSEEEEEACDNWCFHSRFRSTDGRCNNLQRPSWGAALTPFRRVLKQRYVDGIQEPVGWFPSKVSNGFPHPNARQVSRSAVMTKEVTPDPQYSHMLMQWGQFLDHDLDFSLPALSHSSFSDGSSCLTDCSNRAPCFPILIPDGDTSRSRGPVPCIEVVRSSALCGTGLPSLFTNQTVAREQVNQLTSYLDASNVYGSTVRVNDLVRERGSRGLLRTSRHSGRTYLPYAESFPMDCQRDRSAPAVPCFLAGDVRANEQLGLLAMHTLWVREHNRIATRLGKLNVEWDSDRIYHETRKLLGAVMQHVTYKHWLPKILGQQGMEMLGEYKGYNPDLQPSVSNVFATAVLRFGHTLINPVLERLGPGWESVPEGPLPLHKAFFAPHRLLSEGGVDPLLRGLVGAAAKLRATGQLLNEELVDNLFTLARDVALDLGAINIQRGRDHGLPPYTEWRAFCNLTRVHSFDDLRHEIGDPTLRLKLQQLYGHPGNVDLWVGGVSEDLVPGARVGPTFRCLLVEQFRRLRDGDRFWYENPGVFQPSQLTELRRWSLGGVLCASGDAMTRMTSDVFSVPGPNNPIGDCRALPRLQLQPWKECSPQDCGFSFNSISNNHYQRSPGEEVRRSPRSSGHPDDHQVVLDAEDARVEGIEDMLNLLNTRIRLLNKKLKRLRHGDQCPGNSTVLPLCTDNRGQQRSEGERWPGIAPCQFCTCQADGHVWCEVANPCSAG